MSVSLYDDALLDKFKHWTKDTAVSLLSPNDSRDLLQMIADGSNDRPIELPILALKRPGGFSILTKGKSALTFDGLTLGATHEKASQLNAIPISIPYQIDVYTRYQKEADEYIRNLVFNIINYPRLQVSIPYNGQNYIHDANISLSSEVHDNSDIPERLVRGQFVRMTLSITVDDAYLFDVRYRDVYSIEIEPELRDKTMLDDSKDIKLV